MVSFLVNQVAIPIDTKLPPLGQKPQVNPRAQGVSEAAARSLKLLTPIKYIIAGLCIVLPAAGFVAFRQIFGGALSQVRPSDMRGCEDFCKARYPQDFVHGPYSSPNSSGALCMWDCHEFFHD